MRYSFGDVILVPFPFSDHSTSKQRPATVISSETYHREHADVLLMAITSQVRPAAVTEVVITRWQEAGLLKPSLIKGAITTLDPRLVIKKLGRLANEDRSQLAALLRVIIGEQVARTSGVKPPRTERRYWPQGRPAGRGDQRWATFVRNHARLLVACDFFTAVTAMYRVVYVLVVMELGSRRILHVNVTSHPTADWTAQQLRQAIPCDHAYRLLIHDRDSIYSAAVDATIRSLGVRVVRTPVRAPKANSYCERPIVTIRRECLDWLIPLSQQHLRTVLLEWTSHSNHARPHTSLGPGLPDPGPGLPCPLQEHRHRLPPGSRVTARPVLGGLHHEYRLDRAA